MMNSASLKQPIHYQKRIKKLRLIFETIPLSATKATMEEDEIDHLLFEDDSMIAPTKRRSTTGFDVEIV